MLPLHSKARPDIRGLKTCCGVRVAEWTFFTLSDFLVVFGTILWMKNAGVGLNLTKSEAIFYIDHFCGLCGGGGYIVMRKVNGQWRVAAAQYVGFITGEISV